MILSIEALAPYLPRRGRTQEGAALAVYFAMNISRELGDIHRSEQMVKCVCTFLVESIQLNKAVTGWFQLVPLPLLLLDFSTFV